MVDALHEATRALRPGGLLIDARPDSRVLARVERAGRTVATLETQRGAASDDRASDLAVSRVKRDGVLRRIRAGRFWHRMPFADRADFDTYLRDHLRFSHQPRWTAAWRAKAREWRGDPLVVVRAIRFEILTAAAPSSAAGRSSRAPRARALARSSRTRDLR